MSKNKFLAFFLAFCFLPLALAKLALHFDWFEGGTVSQGEWLQQEIFALPALEAHEKVWRLAVIPANECDAVCEQGLYLVQQMYIGLGRKQAQVQPLLASAEPIAEIDQKFPVFQWQHAINHAEIDNHIVIVDVQGLVLLRYPLQSNEWSQADIARHIRTDLLKLMNYDRIRV